MNLAVWSLKRIFEKIHFLMIFFILSLEHTLFSPCYFYCNTLIHIYVYVDIISAHTNACICAYTYVYMNI